MSLSRLGLRLATAVGAALVVGLGALDLGLFVYLRQQADRRLTSQTQLAAAEFALAVQRELLDTPGDLPTSASEALKEWPADSNAFVVYDGAGARSAEGGDHRLTLLAPPAPQLPAGRPVWDVPRGAEGEVRLALARSAGPPPFTVVVLRSTAGLHAANAKLAWWLAFSVPLVMLLGLAGAYVLRLVEQLSDAQTRNRRFLAQVAHQLRTPLTVIRGESGLGLERPRTVEEHRDLLRRVALAAEQMTHRVDDLFLLAQAAAGDRPPLKDHIELDGLVLECVDLMRGRADALGQRLELGTVEPAVVTGSEQLVREAVLELLENACRHGDAAAPIRIAALGNGAGARIEVASRGAPISAAALNGGEGERPDRPGLGLSIVRWIAGVHGGKLDYRRDADVNTLTLGLSAGSDRNAPVTKEGE
ncbi:MAG: sensor histidine kinase [Gemmatimonadales bacterium]